MHESKFVGLHGTEHTSRILFAVSEAVDAVGDANDDMPNRFQSCKTSASSHPFSLERRK